MAPKITINMVPSSIHMPSRPRHNRKMLGALAQLQVLNHQGQMQEVPLALMLGELAVLLEFVLEFFRQHRRTCSFWYNRCAGFAIECAFF